MSAQGLSIEPVGSFRDLLGESPVWDAQAGKLWWIDARGPAIRRHSPGDGRCDAWDLPGRIGSIALAAEGRVVCAMQQGFYEVDLDGAVVTPIRLPEEGNASVRFGEGKVDRQGRFLAATISAEGPPLGKLYRLDADRSAHVLEQGLRIPNCLCFSPKGDVMYLTDSAGRDIWRYDYDVASGEPANRRLFASTAGFGSEADGAAVDVEGYLWVALVRAGKIVRFNPSGGLDRLIDTPAPHPSSLCFGGARLDVLYVTTIADSGRTLRSDAPSSGRLLAVRGHGVSGIAEQRYVFDSVHS